MPLRGRSEIEESSFRGPGSWTRGAHLSSKLIHIGCAAWNIPRQSIAHFESEGTHLQRYSGTFNCCEINSSFYRPHRYDTWKRWSASVPQNFRFSVKAPRTITHDVELKCDPEDFDSVSQTGQLPGAKAGRGSGPIAAACCFRPHDRKAFLRTPSQSALGRCRTGSPPQNMVRSQSR